MISMANVSPCAGAMLRRHCSVCACHPVQVRAQKHRSTTLGELGWVPFRQEVLRSQFSLFGRLCSADSAGTHRGLAARVFRYALGQEHSWAQEVSKNMRDCGIHAPHVWGVSPGCSGRTVAAWRRHCMCPALDRHAVAARRAEVAAVPSLRLFAECHPGLNFCPHVHSSRVSASTVREWTLARCGHHPFLDGRSARHRSQIRPCLCGAAVWSFVHALRSCPLFVPWRRAWISRSHLFGLLQQCRSAVSPPALCGWCVSSPAFIARRLEPMI